MSPSIAKPEPPAPVPFISRKADSAMLTPGIVETGASIPISDGDLEFTAVAEVGAVLGQSVAGMLVP